MCTGAPKSKKFKIGKNELKYIITMTYVYIDVFLVDYEAIMRRVIHHFPNDV